jgi:hypothetical protein
MTQDLSSVKKVAQNVTDKTKNILKSNPDHEEGKLTRAVEDQTSKIPSLAYLGLAAGAFAISIGLVAFKKRGTWSKVTGMLGPAFMIMGLYNKLVKVEGSDQNHRQVSAS